MSDNDKKHVEHHDELVRPEGDSKASSLTCDNEEEMSSTEVNVGSEERERTTASMSTKTRRRNERKYKQKLKKRSEKNSKNLFAIKLEWLERMRKKSTKKKRKREKATKPTDNNAVESANDSTSGQNLELDLAKMSLKNLMTHLDALDEVNVISVMRFNKGQTASIIVSGEYNTFKLINKINKSDIDYNVQLRNNLHFITLDSKNTFKTVWTMLKTENIPFFFFNRREDKNIKVVVKGIPSHVPVDIVFTHLSVIYPVKHVQRMINRRLNIPLPFVLVQMKPTRHALNIYGLANVMEFNVTVEPFQNFGNPTQCFNCQGFFHAARSCYALPKCVYCAGEHLSHKCNVDRDYVVSCANCGDDHRANNKQCPIFLKHKEYLKFICSNRVPMSINND